MTARNRTEHVNSEGAKDTQRRAVEQPTGEQLGATEDHTDWDRQPDAHTTVKDKLNEERLRGKERAQQRQWLIPTECQRHQSRVLTGKESRATKQQRGKKVTRRGGGRERKGERAREPWESARLSLGWASATHWMRWEAEQVRVTRGPLRGPGTVGRWILGNGTTPFVG